MQWERVKRTDKRARKLADEHYSRQTPGAQEFTPPGSNVVLIIPSDRAASAVWASVYQLKADDGFDCWRCTIFRNTSAATSSRLILEAIAATRWHWDWRQLPRDGFHTFVDPAKVQGVKVRGKLVYGFSFMKAGFEEWPERTKQNGLIRWVLPIDKLRAIEPQPTIGVQLRLIA